jgi:hypothetical protein
LLDPALFCRGQRTADTDGFADHGTSELSRLGGSASHNHVRPHPSHAAALFALVEHNGPCQTRIDIELGQYGRRL